MDIPKFLEINGRKYHDKLAFIDGDRRLTYKEVNLKVNSLARSFLHHDLTFGDKILIIVPNSLEFAFSYLSIQRIGAVAVPVSTRLKTEELQYIIEDSGAKAAIFHPDYINVVEPLVETHSILWITTDKMDIGFYSFNDWISGDYGQEMDLPLHSDDEASIIYTSGTTGKPKGVLFTHHNILSVAMMMATETSMKPESRLLHMMPLSHSAPLHLMFVAGLIVGGTHVFKPQFTPHDLLTSVSQEKITHFFGAPVAYLLTAKYPDLKSYDLSSIQYWVYGGAPLSKKDVLFIQEGFQTKRLMGVYGLTEAGPNGTLLTPEEHPESAGSIGRRSALFCEITLLDDDGNPVKDGEVGEIALRSEGTMKEYHRNQEATLLTFKKGWLLTGDLAKRDEHGFYWIIDRKKDVIINGGVNVYPKEVEDVIKQHPSIVDVAVVGVAHPEWGETVKAFVMVNAEVEDIQTTLHSFVANHLADYKCPRLYEAVKELPRNANGKVLKHLLRGHKRSDVM